MVDYRLDEYIKNLSKRQPIDWDELRGSIILEIGSGLDALHKVKNLGEYGIPNTLNKIIGSN